MVFGQKQNSESFTNGESAASSSAAHDAAITQEAYAYGLAATSGVYPAEYAPVTSGYDATAGVPASYAPQPYGDPSVTTNTYAPDAYNPAAYQPAAYAPAPVDGYAPAPYAPYPDAAPTVYPTEVHNQYASQEYVPSAPVAPAAWDNMTSQTPYVAPSEAAYEAPAAFATDYTPTSYAFSGAPEVAPAAVQEVYSAPVVEESYTTSYAPPAPAFLNHADTTEGLPYVPAMTMPSVPASAASIAAELSAEPVYYKDAYLSTPAAPQDFAAVEPEVETLSEQSVHALLNQAVESIPAAQEWQPAVVEVAAVEAEHLVEAQIVSEEVAEVVSPFMTNIAQTTYDAQPYQDQESAAYAPAPAVSNVPEWQPQSYAAPEEEVVYSEEVQPESELVAEMSLISEAHHVVEAEDYLPEEQPQAEYMQPNYEMPAHADAYVPVLDQSPVSVSASELVEHTPAPVAYAVAEDASALAFAHAFERLVGIMDARCDALEKKMTYATHLAIDAGAHADHHVSKKIDVSHMNKRVLDMGRLEELLQNPKVTDIMVNGPDHVFADIAGKMVLTDIKFASHEELVDLAERIAASCGRVLDVDHLLVDGRLPDGSRVNIVAPPLALDGVSLSIRKFGGSSINLDTMVDFGVLSPQASAFLKLAAKSRVNIIVSGGTGTGKTTLLNSLSQYIGEHERVVTIEDSAELQLQQPHVVRLEASQGVGGSGDRRGTAPVTIRELVKNALRMRPERIVVGESRGAEAFDMVQAMNTGHDGSFTSIHANTPRDVIARLENMIGMANLGMPLNAIRKQIASAVHVIVQTTRLEDGSRRITHITEVVGMEGDMVTMQDIFTMKNNGLDANGKANTTMVWEGTFPRHKGLNAIVREANILK